jgi:hypothetical protein
VEKDVRAHGNLVLKKEMMEKKEQERGVLGQSDYNH